MKDWTERMDDQDGVENGGLERRLRAYADARLSPDPWASVRMRAAVIEHGREARAATAQRFTWRRALRPAAFVGLVALLAIGTGASAALAASPGGPLYDARLWVETAILNVSGDGTDARANQMTERIDEITNALDDGNAGAAGAAAQAYGGEVDAAAQAAQTRADLLALRATIARHLAHLQNLPPTNPKAHVNVDKAIAKAIAALAEIDAKLAALPQASPTP